MDTQTQTTNTDAPAANIPAKVSVEQVDALIDSALERLKDQLRERFTEMLANVEVNLSALSEIMEPDAETEDESDNESDENHNQYDTLIRLLASEQTNIETSFFKAIDENDVNKEQTRIEDLTLSNSLSLVDQDEMDEMVAVTAMYANAMNKYEEEVNSLVARFDFLETASNKTLPKFMFNPRHICEAYQAALRQIDTSIENKLILFKLFDQDVTSRLGEMYQSVNHLFIDAGILPEVVYTVERNNQAESSSGASDVDGDNYLTDDDIDDLNDTASQGNYSAPGAGHSAAGAGHAAAGPGHAAGAGHDAPGPGHSAAGPGGPHAQNIGPGSNSQVSGPQDKISRFISQYISGGTTATGEGIPQSFSSVPSETDAGNCYTRNDLMGALSKLQKDLAKFDANNDLVMDAEHIKRAIIADMGRAHGGAITKSVHTLDQRCIDFVGMIFHAIAEDASVSMVITNLLMLLQIPIIKVAMLDESLFTDKHHPARNTLDLITKAGRGVTEDTDRVYLELKTTVNGILEKYDVDRASFETAVDQLNALISKEEEITAEKEKSEQHEIIKQHARDVVLHEMRRITKNKVVPADTRPLLLKNWPTLMFNHYIHHGMESDEWLLALKIFHSLMECLQPIKTMSQWQKLNEDHESLVKAAKEELYKTRQKKEEIDAQMSVLKQTFMTMLDNYRDKHEEAPDTELPELDSTAVPSEEVNDHVAADETADTTEHDQEAARIEERVRIAREKISRLPSNLHPGAWFEIYNGDDKPVRRLKLSVILTEAAKLVFVDRQGVKVIEKDAEDLLNELENKQSRLIADHSTFEHALGSVIHKLAA